jgi:hypothetical protein
VVSVPNRTIAVVANRCETGDPPRHSRVERISLRNPHASTSKSVQRQIGHSVPRSVVCCPASQAQSCRAPVPPWAHTGPGRSQPPTDCRALTLHCVSDAVNHRGVLFETHCSEPRRGHRRRATVAVAAAAVGCRARVLRETPIDRQAAAPVQASTAAGSTHRQTAAKPHRSLVRSAVQRLHSLELVAAAARRMDARPQTSEPLQARTAAAGHAHRRRCPLPSAGAVRHPAAAAVSGPPAPPAQTVSDIRTKQNRIVGGK